MPLDLCQIFILILIINQVFSHIGQSNNSYQNPRALMNHFASNPCTDEDESGVHSIQCKKIGFDNATPPHHVCFYSNLQNGQNILPSSITGP